MINNNQNQYYQNQLNQNELLRNKPIQNPEIKNQTQAVKKPILQLENIGKKFGRTIVLRNISFEVPENSYLGIIGPNGAGKSTLLKIIIGFLKPSAGKIIIEGKTIGSRNIDVRHLFGYASQSNCFYQELTVEENLRYFGRLYWLTTSEIKKRTKELVDLVGLRGHEKIPAKLLSGGMQRKLDIACAIIHAPKILILDEPAAGLDPISAKHLWKILDHIKRIGTTIIISSHILSDLENRCSKIILLNNGRIISQGNPKELIKKPGVQELIIESNPPAYEQLLNDLKQYNILINDYNETNNKLIIKTPEPEKTLYYLMYHMALKKMKLEEIIVSKPTLAEVFEQFVKKDTAMPLMSQKTMMQFNKARKKQ